MSGFEVTEIERALAARRVTKQTAALPDWMKVEPSGDVRASVLGRLAADPTSILLDDDEVEALVRNASTPVLGPPPIDPGIQALRNIVKTHQAVIEGTERIRESFREFSRTVLNTSRQFADLVENIRRLDEETDAERRHRNATTCPVHGATRGGTCWKCRR